MSAIRSLSAEKRTSRGHPISVAIDPNEALKSAKTSRRSVPVSRSRLTSLCSSLQMWPVRTDRDQAAVQCFRSCDPGDIYPYDDRSASFTVS